MNEPLDARTWREIYLLAVKHAVVGVAWDGVECLQAEAPEKLGAMPADLMGKWFADVQTIEAANHRMAKQATTVQERMKADGWDLKVLKGATLAIYYPDPNHRQSADIDLWLLPPTGQSINSHRKALISYLKQQPDITIGEIVYHHVETMIDGTKVEHHVTPTWLFNPVHNRRLQQLFAQAGHITPELQELYTLMHAFRHIYHDGISLRHMLDYYLVCRSNRQAGVPVPVALYKQLGLTTFAQAMDEVAAYLLDADHGTQLESLSVRARHILQALPERHVSRAVRCDYPQETLFRFPWRAVHYLWRKMNHYV